MDCANFTTILQLSGAVVPATTCAIGMAGIPHIEYRNWVWYKEPSPYDHFRQNSYGGKIRIIYVKKDVNLIKEIQITIVISSLRNRVCLRIIGVYSTCRRGRFRSVLIL